MSISMRQQKYLLWGVMFFASLTWIVSDENSLFGQRTELPKVAPKLPDSFESGENKAAFALSRGYGVPPIRQMNTPPTYILPPPIPQAPISQSPRGVLAGGQKQFTGVGILPPQPLPPLATAPSLRSTPTTKSVSPTSGSNTSLFVAKTVAPSKSNADSHDTFPALATSRDTLPPLATMYTSALIRGPVPVYEVINPAPTYESVLVIHAPLIPPRPQVNEQQVSPSEVNVAIAMSKPVASLPALPQPATSKPASLPILPQPVTSKPIASLPVISQPKAVENEQTEVTLERKLKSRVGDVPPVADEVLVYHPDALFGLSLVPADSVPKSTNQSTLLVNSMEPTWMRELPKENYLIGLESQAEIGFADSSHISVPVASPIPVASAVPVASPVPVAPKENYALLPTAVPASSPSPAYIIPDHTLGKQINNGYSQVGVEQNRIQSDRVIKRQEIGHPEVSRNGIAKSSDRISSSHAPSPSQSSSRTPLFQSSESTRLWHPKPIPQSEKVSQPANNQANMRPAPTVSPPKKEQKSIAKETKELFTSLNPFARKN